MSGFFIIGIAINVIVLVLFAVWFIRQWRQSAGKHSGKSPPR